MIAEDQEAARIIVLHRGSGAVPHWIRRLVPDRLIAMGATAGQEQVLAAIVEWRRDFCEQQRRLGNPIQ